jgi:alpha-amylase/alpha-mannosidase (GH57 family)
MKTLPYVCIHGHFYQPPRENAWLDEIEIQESAAPYHDWNERILRECYGPNTTSRILNSEGRISDIVNNYARMSFNFGPTLLSWLEQKAPRTYSDIIAADALSMKLYDGHGSAMAQVYNHIIMPLASRRDKETQVFWGLYDFEKRFNRKAEGMWLAETAVDTETLEVLADFGIKFTVLSPYQAKRFRKIGSKTWTDGIDSRRPYRVILPSGKEINLFFYDGERSKGVAFDGYLNNGQYFADQLLSGHDPEMSDTQLINIATDGESYGHHHKSGDMALAYCMRYIEESGRAKLTNYSQFLALEPPTYEVEIVEDSSWSCAHGIERWRSNCGCHTGGPESWSQEWRVGLRTALDNLRDAFTDVFEKEMSAFCDNPWQLRNEYIAVIYDRTRENALEFAKKHTRKELSAYDMTRFNRLLEMQRHALYMYTSCGWFFNDLSGIETVQILQYAARGIQLAESVQAMKLKGAFLKDLDTAYSNLPSHGSGKQIYETQVAPKALTLTQVGMHYAVDSLFEESEKEITVLNYDCTSDWMHKSKMGTYVFASGFTRVRSRVTLSEKEFSFAILYLGNHHLVGSTSNALNPEEFESTVLKAKEAFDQGNLSACIDIIKRNFQEKSFSYFDLFKDQQLSLLKRVIGEHEERALASHEKIYDSSYSLLNLMNNSSLAVPKILKRNLETVFEYKLEDLFGDTGKPLNFGRLERYVESVEKWHADSHMDYDRLNYLATNLLIRRINRVNEETDLAFWLEKTRHFLKVIERINIRPDISRLQNFVFRLVKENNLNSEVKKSATELAEHILLDLSSNAVTTQKEEWA